MTMTDTGQEAKTPNIQALYDRAAELRKDFAELPEGQRSADANAALQGMFDEVNLIDAQITLAEMEERRSHALSVGPAAATASGIRSSRGHEVRSVGQRIVNDELVKWAQGSRPGSEFMLDLSDQGTLQEMLDTRAVQDWSTGGPPGVTTSGTSTGASDLLPVGQPIAPVPRQARLFLRDLFPKMTTTLAAIPYVRELNPTTYESASAVAEGGTKPNATLSFQAAKADPTVIAATLVISKQLFEDAAAVIQYINQRLPYIVAFKEDQEFLKGSGNWPDIEGLVNTPGIQLQGPVGTTTAQTFGTAFAKVELHDGSPTAVVINPAQAWKMFTHRAAGGAGTFDAGTPFSALPLTVWGVPSYRTRAMTTGKALVGDFQLGGMIADREAVNVQMYRERYAELNQILLVCEERVGLLTFRPDLFVTATIPTNG